MEPSPGDRTLRLAGFPLILLIYGWVYSFRLTLYPLFIDEAIHIRWARDTLMLSPFAPFDEGKLLMGAALTPFFPFDNGVFTARMVIVLVGMLGLAAAMALGTRLWGARAGLTAGLLLTLMPLGVFFGRMALPDPLGMSLLLVAAALTVEALHSGRALPAFAAGVALALAAFTRLTMMVYLVVPVVGWVLIKRSNVQIARIYAAVLLTALPFLVGGVLAGSIGLEHASGFVEPAPVLQRAGQHIRRAWRWLSVYATVPLLVISLVGAGWGILRRDRGALFVLAGLALPLLAVLWLVSDITVARYYMPPAAAGVLLTGGLIWWIADRLPGGWVWGTLASAILVVGMLPFVATALERPADLPLPGRDYRDYLTQSTSGYGVAEGSEWLYQYAEANGPVTVICGARVTCDWLDTFHHEIPGVAYASSDGLMALEPDRITLYANDDPPQFSSVLPDERRYNVVEVARFVRPGGESAFVFYRLSDR